MSIMDTLKKKESEPGFKCMNCNHGILQDSDSGKWFHSVRDTKDLCNMIDKNTVCKCEQATPVKLSPAAPKPIDRVTNVGSVREEPVVDNTPPIGDGRPLLVREIYNRVFTLFSERGISWAESIIILDGIIKEMQVLYNLENLYRESEQK